MVPDLYSHMTSACESGWDFSSRWFSREDDSLDLNTTRTKDIIPVDLNSILCSNEMTMYKLFNEMGKGLTIIFDMIIVLWSYI